MPQGACGKAGELSAAAAAATTCPPPAPVIYAAADQQRKAARKGKTLEQIENEEGGPVKESQVGMAQTRRASKRKGAAADTDLLEDVEVGAGWLLPVFEC